MEWIFINGKITRVLKRDSTNDRPCWSRVWDEHLSLVGPITWACKRDSIKGRPSLYSWVRGLRRSSFCIWSTVYWSIVGGVQSGKKASYCHWGSSSGDWRWGIALVLRVWFSRKTGLRTNSSVVGWKSSAIRCVCLRRWSEAKNDFYGRLYHICGGNFSQL